MCLCLVYLIHLQIVVCSIPDTHVTLRGRWRMFAFILIMESHPNQIILLLITTAYKIIVLLTAAALNQFNLAL